VNAEVAGLKYRADIDGLRALAVIPVIIYHAGAAWLPGGFVGVDVFFVISGFLISKIILGEMERNSFSFIDFYKRRVDRIVPALVFMVVVVLLVFSVLGLPDQSVSVAKSAISAIFSVSNFYFWGGSGYFSPSSDFMPLLHTWSLAVEEQFYLFFPVLMIVLFRLKLNIKMVIAVGAIVMFVFGWWLSIKSPMFAYYMLPARAWELALGVALAVGVVPKSKSIILNETLTALGAILIVLSFFYVRSDMVFPGVAALIPCAGAALIINFGGDSFVSKRLLSCKPIVYVGLISYSLYLWHWPILTFLRVVNASVHLDRSMVVLGMIVTLVLSIISWRYVEVPFRRKDLGDLKKIVLLGGGVAVAGIVSFLVILGSGFPSRLSPHALEAVMAAKDIDPLRDECFGTKERGGCTFGDQSLPVSYIVVGDSHAAALRPAISASSLVEGERGTLYWMKACPLLDGSRRVNHPGQKECKTFKENVWRIIEGDRSIETVFLGGRWPYQVTGTLPENGGSLMTLMADDVTATYSKNENELVFIRSLKRTVDRLAGMGKKVVIIGSVPEAGFNVPESTAMARNFGREDKARVPFEVAGNRARFSDEIIMNLLPESASFYPVLGAFCDDEWCDFEKNGTPVFYDSNHLSYSGALNFIAPVLSLQNQNGAI
tara:strand:- start:451 stop:2427 length:1977 start_codon:yes stop_codon:yes gene_type:complete